VIQGSDRRGLGQRETPRVKSRVSVHHLPFATKSATNEHLSQLFTVTRECRRSRDFGDTAKKLPRNVIHRVRLTAITVLGTRWLSNTGLYGSVVQGCGYYEGET